MYESYFGLNDKPFKLTPDPRFFYASSHHKKAMSYLHYGFERGDGFVVVTGPSGTGKTAVARNFINSLDSSTATVQISTASLASYDLINMVALSFELPVEGLNKPEILKRLESFFYQLYQQNKRALIIIDEAQHLTPEKLDELRILSNFQFDNIPLVQGFLFGQNELESILRSPEMEQFRQRIIASCQLNALDVNEIQSYVEARLSIAGWQGTPVLDRDIYSVIEQKTSGVPSKINLLMDRVLLYSYLSEIKFINRGVINEVLLDMQNELLSPSAKSTAEKIQEPRRDDLQFNCQYEPPAHAGMPQRDDVRHMNKPVEPIERYEQNISTNIQPDSKSTDIIGNSVMDSRSINHSAFAENTSDSVLNAEKEKARDSELDALSLKQEHIHAEIDKVLKKLDLVSDVLDRVIARKLATMQHFDKMIIKKRRQASMLDEMELSDDDVFNDVDLNKL